jgi:hypothetical protein
MTNEQLTADIHDLGTFLIDVWEWDHLDTLAHQCNEVYSKDHPEVMRDNARKIEREIDQHLLDRYLVARNRVADTAKGLFATDLSDLLIERLKGRLNALIDPELSFSIWSAQVPAFDSWAGQFTDEEIASGSCWHGHGHVTRQLYFYMRRVIAELDGYRNSLAPIEGQQSKIGTASERIRWNDTASRLAYLFHELEAAGYITPPQRKENGELKPNWSAVARTLHAAFDIRKVNGDPVKLTGLDAALKLEGDVDKLGGKAAFKITPRRG